MDSIVIQFQEMRRFPEDESEIPALDSDPSPHTNARVIDPKLVPGGASTTTPEHDMLAVLTFAFSLAIQGAQTVSRSGPSTIATIIIDDLGFYDL